MTNGTVALYCCLKALNIGAGDEVLVPDMTFIASANAVLMAGAKPVFCDVDEKTFCIDVAKAKKKITKKTKAIMPVHLYGQSADMDAVMEFATKLKATMKELENKTSPSSKANKQYKENMTCEIFEKIDFERIYKNHKGEYSFQAFIDLLIENEIIDSAKMTPQ